MTTVKRVAPGMFAQVDDNLDRWSPPSEHVHRFRNEAWWLQILDEAGVVEHGSTVTFAWITEAGKDLLAALNERRP